MPAVITPSRLIALGLLLCLAAASAPPAAGQEPRPRQDDWSGGPGEAGPVTDPGDRFDASTDIAWRSVPGRISLASVALATPIETLVVDDAGIPDQVSAGDLDGDGQDELVSVDPVTDPFNPKGAIWWWDRGQDGAWTRHAVSEDFHGAEHTATADIDGDGDLDVIGAAYYGVADPPPPGGETRNGRYAWFENLAGDGSSWQQHLVGELYWGANWIAAGDLDGDGDLDLAGASELTDGIFEQEADIAWFENLDGDGDAWASHTVADFFENASEVHMVDLDRDGDLDLVGAHGADIGFSTHSWWENVAGDASLLVQHEVPGQFSGSGYVDAGDLDGDGDIDLMGGGLLGSSLLVWENLDGQAGSWTVWLVGTLVSGRVLELVDLDGDGDLDALTASGLSIGSGASTWYENTTGGGLSWTLHTIVSRLDGSNPWAAAADVDGDGILEVGVANEDVGFPQDRQLLAFELFLPRPAGELTSSVLDGGDAPPWGFAGWDADLPTGTALTVEVRASDDPGDLGAWAPVAEPGTDLATVVDPASRYLQYRLSLTAGLGSPVIRSIDLDALALLPPDPGIAGTDNLLVARWRRPGETVTFVAGTGTGTREIPSCPGVAIGVGRPRLLGTALVDASGEARLTVPIPGGAAGRPVRLQAVGRSACSLSAPLEVTFE